MIEKLKSVDRRIIFLVGIILVIIVIAIILFSSTKTSQTNTITQNILHATPTPKNQRVIYPGSANANIPKPTINGTNWQQYRGDTYMIDYPTEWNVSKNVDTNQTVDVFAPSSQIINPYNPSLTVIAITNSDLPLSFREKTLEVLSPVKQNTTIAHNSALELSFEQAQTVPGSTQTYVMEVSYIYMEQAKTQYEIKTMYVKGNTDDAKQLDQMLQTFSFIQ